MKLSKKQQQDIDCIKYFIPEQWKDIQISDEDIEDFLNYSDKGIKIKRPIYLADKKEVTGYDALLEGKRWRGIHMQMWEDGVLSGDVPYRVLLGEYDNDKKRYQFWKSPHKPMPKLIVDFMKKELFKGIDSELIERTYNELYA